jgi:hypothetical protein
MKMTAFWNIAPCTLVEVDRRFQSCVTVSIIVLMIRAVRASETWVYFNEATRSYIPEDCHLYTYRREI